ncbi:MAG: rhodanese-like domain-containing protein [Betaproteobacteria bacterium]|nr:MAG: rhodanese-like domain-containing protein [Betaproteobacteria bacterium]
MRRIAYLVLLLGAITAQAEPDLSAPQAFERSNQGGLLIIDIRTPEEWRETGVIPGARRVDFYRGPDVLLKSVLQMVNGDRNAPIALVCHSGSRTIQAQRFLQAQGFTQVYNVREGMAGSAAGPGWLHRPLPVEACPRC